MGNDGVMTTSDYIKQQNIEAEQVKIAPLPKNVKLERKYQFPVDVKGESKTIIKFEGKEFKIEMMDGVYAPPKSWTRARTEKFHKVIQLYGFIDKSVATKTKEEKFIYTISHPENTDDEKITGEVSLRVKRKELKFKCENGLVKTERKDVFDGFLKKGWNEVSIKPLES